MESWKTVDRFVCPSFLVENNTYYGFVFFLLKVFGFSLLAVSPFQKKATCPRLLQFFFVPELIDNTCVISLTEHS